MDGIEKVIIEVLAAMKKLYQNITLAMNSHWLLFGVLAIATTVRMIGIQYGLPFHYNLDEAQVVMPAIRFGTGDLNPHSFIYPPFFSYFLFVLNSLFFAVGYLFQIFKSVSEFKIFYYSHPEVFYLIGRCASTLFGVGTVYLTYLLGKKAYQDKSVGLTAALFVALMPLHFRYSRLALTDVPMGFFVLLSLYFSYSYYCDKKIWHLVVSGISAGVAIATKYNAGLIIIPIVMAHLFIWINERNKNEGKSYFTRFVIHLFLVLVGFFVVNPYSILDFKTFIYDIHFNSIVSASDGAASQSWFAYIQYFFLPEHIMQIGNYFGILCLIGTGYALYKRTQTDLLLILFPLVHFTIFSVMVTNPIKAVYMIPVMPVYCIMGARMVWLLIGARKYSRRFAVIFLLIISFWPARYIGIKCYSASRLDTATAARQWIEHNIPSGSRILYSDRHDLMLKENKQSIVKNFQQLHEQSQKLADFSLSAEKIIAAEKNQGPTYYIERFPQKWGNVTSEKLKQLDELPLGLVPLDTQMVSLEYWLKKNVDYIIVFPKQRLKYLNETAKKQYPAYYQFYSTLENQGKMVKEFKPDRVHFTGYAIEIFEMKNFGTKRDLIPETENTSQDIIGEDR